MESNECFKIDISTQERPPLVSPRNKTIKRIDAGRWYSIGDPAWVVADPFLFVHRGGVKTRILISLVLCLLDYVLSLYKVKLPYSITTALIVQLFMEIGYEVKKMDYMKHLCAFHIFVTASLLYCCGFIIQHFAFSTIVELGSRMGIFPI